MLIVQPSIKIVGIKDNDITIQFVQAKNIIKHLSQILCLKPFDDYIDEPDFIQPKNITPTGYEYFKKICQLITQHRKLIMIDGNSNQTADMILPECTAMTLVVTSDRFVWMNNIEFFKNIDHLLSPIFVRIEELINAEN